MQTHETQGKCPVCKSLIVAVVSTVSTVPDSDMVYGPGSKDQFTQEVSFHCPKCQIIFRCPPGDEDTGQRILSQVDSRNASTEQITEILKEFPVFKPKGRKLI